MWGYDARTRRFARLFALALVSGLAACDNPVEAEDHPVALVLIDAQGNQVASATAEVATGSVNLALNQATTFTVAALGEEGERIELDGTELSVEVMEQPQGLTATLQGTNQLVLTGTAAGATTLDLTLHHGGHPEFQATFPVVVQ